MLTLSLLITSYEHELLDPVQFPLPHYHTMIVTNFSTNLAQSPMMKIQFNEIMPITQIMDLTTFDL